MGWNDERNVNKRLYDLGRLVSDWLWETDADGRFTYLSERLIQVAGIHPEELIGKTFTDLGCFLSHDGTRNNKPDFKSPFRNLRFQHERQDGKTCYFNISSLPIYSDDSGNFEGARGTASDVTDRVKAEQALKEKEELVEVLFQTTVKTNESGDVAEALHTCLKIVCEYLDWSLGHVLVLSPLGKDYGLLSTGIWFQETADGFENFRQISEGKIFSKESLSGRALAAGEPVFMNDLSKGADKNRAEIAIQAGLKTACAVPILVGQDVAAVIEFFSTKQVNPDQGFLNLLEHMGTLLGRIIERKTSEDSLKNSEKRIRAVMDNVVDAIITINEKGIVRSVNPATEQIFGYSAEEMIDQNISMVMPEPHRSKHDDYIQRYLDSGKAKVLGFTRELTGIRKNGEKFPLDLAASELRLGEERLFVGIIRDITERKRIESMKKEFISTVSHELRTPLTSIMGSLGLIIGGAIDGIPDKAIDMINIAHSNSQRLVRLINDILDMEKIETGKMHFSMGPVDVSALVRAVVRDNQSFAHQYGVQFKFADITDDLCIHGDEGRLRQVLENLLSNAAKFSPEGEDVLISVDRGAAGVRISVVDRGAGIPKEFHHQIFEKFTQSDASDTRKIGGTGLGLSIVKAIVERHGGEITFDSEPGRGTSFYVVLPERQAVGGRLADSQNLLLNKVRAQSTPNILICEDDRDLAILFASILEESGVAVDIAGSAEEAKDLLAKKQYALLMLDLILPGQDGISLIRDLRSAPETKNLPIVVASAKASEGKQELSGEAVDIIDWMEKPIDEKRLLDGMTRVLNVTGIIKPDGSKPKILHVEDDPDIINVIAVMVGKLAEVHAATSLREARLLLKQDDYDLVILDLALPDGKGEALLPLLKTQKGPTVPVIVFSAREIDAKAAKNISKALVKSKASHEEIMQTVCSAIEASYNVLSSPCKAGEPH